VKFLIVLAILKERGHGVPCPYDEGLIFSFVLEIRAIRITWLIWRP